MSGAGWRACVVLLAAVAQLAGGACATGRDESAASNSDYPETDGAPDGPADGGVWPGDASSDGPDETAADATDSSAPIEGGAVDAKGDALGPSACGVAGGVTVTAGSRQAGASDAVEVYLEAPVGQVITGLGLRVNGDDIKTFRVRVQAVLPGGALGPPQDERGGVEPGGTLEANVDLPDCVVLVGFAARSNSGNAQTLVLWGAPLSPDGTLGVVQEYRGGDEPAGGVEGEYHAPAGRVVTGAGLGVSSDDVDTVKSATDAWLVQ